ncbi:MAG: type II and III secretion system protein, partial [Pirellulaceae bacterium]|nr:type II and III secretion system protein [Pirellulaceae bacterium]
EENRDILINLDLIHSRLAPPQPSLKLAEDNDETMTPPIAASSLRKSVRVPNGQTVVLGGDDARRSDENTLLVVLLTARIVERAAAR